MYRIPSTAVTEEGAKVLHDILVPMKPKRNFFAFIDIPVFLYIYITAFQTLPSIKTCFPVFTGFSN